MKSLSVPEQPLQDSSWNFITGLTDSNSYYWILGLVDRLTKIRHLISCTDKITTKDLADLFIQNIWRVHGFWETIISDHGLIFSAEFWKQTFNYLEIGSRLSTAFQPETDGQIERMSSTFEEYLRAYMNYFKNDWNKFLPIAGFVANNWISESIGITPIFANTGQNHNRTF